MKKINSIILAISALILMLKETTSKSPNATEPLNPLFYIALIIFGISTVIFFYFELENEKTPDTSANVIERTKKIIKAIITALTKNVKKGVL